MNVPEIMQRSTLIKYAPGENTAWREAAFNWDGSIDVQLNHPLFGWIPFTARPDDIEEHGRAIFWRLFHLGVATPYDYEGRGLPDAAYDPALFPGRLPPAKPAIRMTRRQLFGGR